MKLILVVSAGLILSIFYSNAQTYYSFPTKKAIWTEMYTKANDAGYVFHSFALKNGDTLIKGKVFNKLYHSTDTVFTENNLCGGLREENKKVYYYSIRPVQLSDFLNMYVEKDTEVLLYDFSLKIGDTIKNGLIRVAHPGTLILYKIDSVLVGKDYRNSFLFGVPGINIAAPFMQWIEGLGYLRGLLFATGDIPTNGLWNDVICFKQEEKIIYHNSRYKACYYSNSDDITQLEEEPDISIQPNPTDKVSELKFPKDQFNKAVLYNINGYLVEEFNIQGQNSIIIKKNTLSSGMYFIHLIGPRKTFTIKAVFK